jgi:O-methyltransferase
MKKALADVYDFFRFGPIFKKYQPYTMIYSRRYFIENLMLVSNTLNVVKDGAVIECGTWKGGMAAAMVEVGGHHREYHFFDSFEGLPPAEDLDGKRAKAYQAATDHPEYYDNCKADMGYINTALELTGCPQSQLHIHPGFFENSLPSFEVPPIAVLRLDADWYASTMICLQKFWYHVLPGGLVLIDDYHTWDGCTRAVHDFLSDIKSHERIRQGRIAGTAYIQRRNED